MEGDERKEAEDHEGDGMNRGALNGKKTNADTIITKAKAANALELRKQGKTFAAIAVEAGYNSPQAAFEAVRREIQAITREPATELIELELERIDALWMPQFQTAQTGDTQALEACIKLMARRAKLLGLDAPVKVAETDPAGNSVGPRTIELVAPSIVAADVGKGED